MSSQVLYHVHPTPLGAIRLAAHDAGLVEAVFLDSPAKERDGIPHLGNKKYLYAQYQRQQHRLLPTSKHIEQARAALDRYFRGDALALSTVALAPQGTEFQQLIWNGLRRIPFGKIKNYSDLADDVAQPKAIRAAGTACKRNPVILFIPCHRVIGKDQTLTGFNGGLERKAFLLQHEGLLVTGSTQQFKEASARTKITRAAQQQGTY